MGTGYLDGPDGLASVDWGKLLRVFMHDPVDKALGIRGHEKRAARYAAAALGQEVDRFEISFSTDLADQLVAMTERIPMPTAGPGGERAVGPESGQLEIRHPVSGCARKLDLADIDEAATLELIDKIVDGLPDAKSRYLAIWRLLPDRIEERSGSAMAMLPADTRVPDHTVFHHADIACGLWASRTGNHGSAYLSMSVGPVQPFIAAARTVRDLWTGSAILSWLTFQAMRPVITTLGPTALVFPALRGAPLMDLWLRSEARLDRVPMPDERRRRSPSMPNRFVALVPWGENGGDARAFADACTESARSAWRCLAASVHNRLGHDLSGSDKNWDIRWTTQVESFFEFRTSMLPERDMDDAMLASLIDGSDRFERVWPNSSAVRGLASAIPDGHRPGHDQERAGRWQAQLEVSARLMEASRSIRHVPDPAGDMAEGPWPAKCTLLGTYEQMGPAEPNASRSFWKDALERLSMNGARLRSGERLSAVALCKRFAAPARLADELELERENLRFPDTATVAARTWLKCAKEADLDLDPDTVRSNHGDWNGRWLHDHGDNAVTDDEPPAPPGISTTIRHARKNLGRPPSYYAILMMDADNMGLWLKGDRAPRLRDVLHPAMVRYYEELDTGAARAGLEARRPVGPALHASISAALKDYAVQIVPELVAQHCGTLIYAGGDDVLALLPAREAVPCALELERRFQGRGEGAPGWIRSGGREWTMMGTKATMSAGIVFVHMKNDLRLALEAARNAEKRAKNHGRNLLSLDFMRRSGEHSKAELPWQLAPWFQKMVEGFANGATTRWTYRLRAELPGLQGPGLPDEAIAAEIRRLVDRTDDGGGAGTARHAGADAHGWWMAYRQAWSERDGCPGSPDLLASFTALCQGAAFVARGNDV